MEKDTRGPRLESPDSAAETVGGGLASLTQAQVRQLSLMRFEQIPPSAVDDPPVVFQDFNYEPDPETQMWVYPAIFDVYGERVQLLGPVQTKELARRNKIRLVEVYMYRFPAVTNSDGEVVPGNVPERYRVEWGWQGEHQMIHLITDSGTLDYDPLGDLVDTTLDSFHRRYNRLAYGKTEEFEGEA